MHWLVVAVIQAHTLRESLLQFIFKLNSVNLRQNEHPGTIGAPEDQQQVEDDIAFQLFKFNRLKSKENVVIR